jgi:large repetitive protein
MRGSRGLSRRRWFSRHTRVRRLIAVLTIAALGWGAAAANANAAQLPGFPSVHLPSMAKIRSWLASDNWGPLPQPASGTAAGHSHTAPAAATRATGGAGRPTGKSPTQLPPYTPLRRLTKVGPSGSSRHGFDARTSKRVAAKSTATSNYFQNADGSYTRQLSQQQVNYQDSSGVWQPIDTALAPAAGGGWAEKANSLSVGFAGSAAAPALATVGFGAGRSASLGLSGAAATSATVSGSTATYPEVTPATDLKLTATSTGLEVSLVLHSATAAGSWTFPLTLAGLSARQAADGSIQLVDPTGKTVGAIPPAYAYDSAKGQAAGTHAVTYQLEPAGAGQQLVMTLDSAWLHDPARVFPVTVDPNMGGTSDSETTYVESPSAETGDHSGEPTMFVGSSDSGTHDANSFIDFPADGLDGSTVTVTAASLSLFDVYSATCTAERFDVAAVTEAWTPSQTTTYPGPTYGTSIGNLTPAVPNSCANTSQNLETGDYLTVPLSVATFNSWSSSGANDFGLALYAATTDALHWKEFASANTINGPVLSLTYDGTVLPVISSQYPNNGDPQTTLTPVLSASGSQDPNIYPGTVKFDFQVANSSGTVLTDSGLTTSSYYTVPSGKLVWGEDYYWTVQAYDGTNYSLDPVWNSFTTQVPQPVITSSLSQNTDGHGYNGAIGNYTTSATDATVQTVGPSLDVVRDYNSQDPRSAGAFGTAWSSVFDSRATEHYDSTGAVQSVVVTYPDGSEVGYGKNSGGSFSPPQGRFATFAAVTGGYSLIDKNDTEYLYTESLGSGAYGITSITDALARTEVFNWSTGSSPQITSIHSNTSDRNLFLAWFTPTGAASAHIQTVTTDDAVVGNNATALTWTYGYTGDKLSTVCPPGTTTACTAYTYGQTGSPYETAVLDEGASSMWPLSESSGTTAADAVIANEGAQNATYSNVTLGQPGPLTGGSATAAGFDGTSSVVDLPSLHLGTTPNFSFSLWFQTTTDDGVLLSSSDNPLAASSTEGNFTPTLYVGSDGKLNALFWQNVEPTPIVSSAAVTDGAWHHVVFSSAPNVQTLWLDGVEVGTQPGWSSLGDLPTAPWLLAHTYLGAGYLGYDWPDQPYTDPETVYASYFKGTIADAAYFTRPLTQADVTEMVTARGHADALLTQINRPSGKTYAQVTYDGPNNAVSQVIDQNNGTWNLSAPTVTGSSQVYRSAVLGAGPQDYYRLGDNVGTLTAANEVHGGTATYENVTLGVAGPFADENAASFNGTSSYVELPNGVLSTAPQSVGIWFNTTHTSEVLVGAATGPLTGSWPPYNAEMYVGSDGKLVAEAWTGDAYTPMYSTTKVDDGKWHFAVLSAQSGTQSLYVDGADVATKTGTVSMAADVDVTIGAGWLGGTWPDNSASGGTSVVQYFNGSIAEAAVYSKALTSDQVAVQYAAADGSQGLSPVESVAVTDPTGKTLTDRYDVDNGYRELSQTDGLGNTTSYGYDTSGYLYTVTDPDGDVTTTGHDVRGNMVSQTTCQNQAAKICSTSYYTYYPDDTSTQLTADPRNDLVETVRDGRSSSATDNTYLTTYTYDVHGDKTGVTTPPVPGYPSGRTTTITYSDGTTAFPAADIGDMPAGLPVKTVSPGGATNLVSYYNDGDVAWTVNADGLTTDFTYDNLGRVQTKTVSPRLTVGSWPLTQTTGTSVTDLSGSGNTATEANVTWTGTSGTFNGTSSYMQLPNNLTSASTYDSISLWFKTSTTTAGTLLSTGNYEPGTTPGPNAMPVLYVGSDGKLHGHFWDFTATGMSSTATVDNGAWHHVVLTGSGVGQTLYLDGAVVGTEPWQIYNSDPYEFVGAGVYNSDGWPDAPSGNVWNYFTGSIANVQLYHETLSAAQVSGLYSAGTGGSAIANQNPANLTTSYQYDGNNNVVTEIDPPVTDRVSGAVHTPETQSVYDVDGDLTSQTVSDTTGGDTSRTVSSTYNAYDEQETATDGNSHTTTYAYDDYGNRTSETDPNGNITTWVYDADSHVQSQSLSNYTGSPLDPLPSASKMEWSKAYDPAGRLASLTDSMGNVTKYTYFDNGLSATATRYDPTGADSYVVESDTYDAAGNQIGEVTDNGATSETISVDAADRTAKTVLDPTGVDRTTTYVYTPDDQVASTTQSGPSGATATTTATYDPMGNQLSQTLYQDGSGHPTGWWPMTQTSGTSITDASGTGNAANASNVTWNGTAGVFNGSSSAAVTSGPVLNTAASYTISAWVYETSASTAQTFVAQLGTQSSSFLLQNDPGTDKWRFAVTNADVASPTYTGVESTTIALNTWTYLVGTYNTSTGSISLSVNNATPVSATFTSGWSSSGALAIGRNVQGGTAAQYTNGQIANVQVYPRVLSSLEIGTLYTNGRGGGTTASTSTTTSRTLDVRGLPTSSTDPDGNVTDYVYDEAGNLAETIDPTVSVESNGGTPVMEHPETVTGYNTFGEVAESQNPDNVVVHTYYDGNGNKTSQVLPNYTPPGGTTITDATTIWTYDPDNQLTKVTDPLSQSTNYTYDQLGDVVQTTDPLGNATTAVYNTDGQETSLQTATGAVSDATYDWMGRTQTSVAQDRYPSPTSSTTTYSYAASAANPDGAFLASATTQDGAVTSYGYDNTGEQTKVTDPAGNSTTTAYDFLGRPITTTLPDSSTESTVYDAEGDVVQSTLKDPLGNQVVQTSASYDPAGRELSSTDGRGYKTTYTYDATGAPIQEVQPVSATLSITTSFGYDAAGNTTRYTDGRGNKTIYTYNAWGQQESVIEPETSTYNTAALSTFTTAYDADGRPVTETSPGGVTTTNTYDADGNVKEQQGSSTSIGDAATATRNFTYDYDNRVTQATTTAEGTSGTAGYQLSSTINFTYDDRDDLLTTTGTGGTTTFGYNGDGLMTSRADAAGTTSYGYTNPTDPDQLTTLTDADTGVAAQYSYNDMDQVSQIQYGTGGDKRLFTYNTAHELSGDSLVNAGETSTYASIGYVYDADSDLMTKTTTGFAGGSVTNHYTYDEADRLSTWTVGTGTPTDYSYDASGNRTQAGSNVYTYDARDELTSDGVNSYTYTARGTLSAETSSTASTTYSTDAYNQQIISGTQTYSYDASGRMMTDATAGGGTRDFAYSGAANILASDSSSTYSWDPSDDLVGIGAAATGGGTTAGSGTLAYVDAHTDVVGDFTATATSLSGSTTYDPLGNVTATSSPAGSLGYQSGWTDTSTGKVDMGSRWYNPATGQFMNKDTAQVSPTPASASANPFAYAGDNPMTGEDPTGHCPFGLGFGCTMVNAFNRDVIQPAWHYVDTHIIQPAENALAAAFKWASQQISTGWHDLTTAINKLNDALALATAELAIIEKEITSAASWANKQVTTVSHTASNFVSTTYHQTVSAAKKAVASTVNFVKNHAAAIASIAAGAGVFAGCEVLSLGIGTVGCAALAGAAASGVSYAMSCGKSPSGCSLLGGVEAVGIGAIGGAIGGALAGPLGGKLVSEALDGVLPDIVSSALIGSYSGSGAGAISGGLTYAAGCGSSQDGCSWSGFGGSVLGGAEQGGLSGGIGGGLGSVAGHFLGGGSDDGGGSPDSDSSDGPGCSGPHSFVGSTAVLMADGNTKPIDQVKVGDEIADSVPGQGTVQDHKVTAVIVTTTDHDFVGVTVAPVAGLVQADQPAHSLSAAGAGASSGSGTFKRAALGLAAAVMAVAGTLAGLHGAAASGSTSAATGTTMAAVSDASGIPTAGGTLTTTFHHPFYDVTQSSFVQAQYLAVGDELQTPTGYAVITNLHLYHADTTTYDLTIGTLHTYYVLAGSTPVLVHNINPFDAQNAACGIQAPLFLLDDGEISSPEQIANSRVGGGSRAGQYASRQDLLAASDPGPYTCWRCGEQSPNPKDMQLGHVNVPTSGGGNLDDDNICLEGATCNIYTSNGGSVPPGKSCVEMGGCGAIFGSFRDSYSNEEWGRT